MDILQEQFTNIRLVLFSGVSGSGKTTCMQELLREHGDYKDQPRTEISGCPVEWPDKKLSTKLVVIDELVYLRDFRQLLRLLRYGHNIIAASHLSAVYLLLLQCFWKTRIFHTDRDPNTICRYLEQQGVACSETAVRDFCNVFGASYVDARIVLEQYPGCCFDQAWSRFKRTSTITRVPMVKIRKHSLQAET